MKKRPTFHLLSPNPHVADMDSALQRVLALAEGGVNGLSAESHLEMFDWPFYHAVHDTINDPLMAAFQQDQRVQLGALREEQRLLAGELLQRQGGNLDSEALREAYGHDASFQNMMHDIRLNYPQEEWPLRIACAFGHLMDADMMAVRKEIAALNAMEFEQYRYQELLKPIGYNPENVVAGAQHYLAAAHRLHDEQGHVFTPDDIRVSPTSSLFMLPLVLQTLKNMRGDGEHPPVILIPDPHFHGHDFIADLVGYEIVPVRSSQGPGHLPTGQDFLDAARRVGLDNIGAVLITDPNVPTGQATDAARRESWVQALTAIGAPVIADEVFAGTSRRHESLGKTEALKDLFIGVTSPAKTIGHEQEKCSICFTKNQQFLAALDVEMQHLPFLSFRPWEAGIMAQAMTAVTSEKLHEHAESYQHNREHCDRWMRHANWALKWFRGVPKDALQWLAPPEEGILGSVTFLPELLEKAGIHTSAQLAEYVREVAGVALGPVLYSGDEQNMPPALILNLGDDKAVMQGLAKAARNMSKGIAYDDIAVGDNDLMDRAMSAKSPPQHVGKKISEMMDSVTHYNPRYERGYDEWRIDNSSAGIGFR